MTARELKDQVVEVTGLKFHVLQALDFGEEYSLVGYWMDGDKEPDPPHIQQVIVPVDLITLIP
jgi:hypothetical protein